MPEPPQRPRPAIPPQDGSPPPAPLRAGSPPAESSLVSAAAGKNKWPAGGGEPEQPADLPAIWRVDRKLPVLKLIAAAIIALSAAVLATDRAGLALAAAVVVGLALWAVRDLAVPVRLAADVDGLTLVEGVARRRRLTWSQIDRVRLDQHQRLGLRTEYLELDGGETLHLFSQYDLGVPPEEAAEVLAWLRDEHERRNEEPGDEREGRDGAAPVNP
jgi:hypothetical protein